MSFIEFASKELIIPLVKSLGKSARDHEEDLRAIGDEFFDPFTLSRLYIEPNCQHYNPADTDEDTHAISEIRGQVFDVLGKFLAGDDVSCTGGNNQLLVLADAGMGKTSLLVMLKLFHWGGNWPAGIKCVLIKLGDDSLERVNNLTDRANTVLLLDSLDEDPSAWNRLEQRLIDLLDATKNFRRVVISCRTQFFPEGDADPFARLGKLEVGGFVCPMFYLSPFSSEQVDEYLEKKFPTTGIERLLRKQNPKKAKAGEILEKMHSLRMRPFLLANIEDLMENSDTNWNDYSVYAALVKRWLLREETRIREQARNRESSLESLPNQQKLWSVCEVVACWMYENRVRTLSQTDFKTILSTFPDIKLIKELEHGSKSLLNKNSQGNFRFSHYSIQEFLVVHTWEGKLDAARFTSQMWKFVDVSGKYIPTRWIPHLPSNLILNMKEIVTKAHRSQKYMIRSIDDERYLVFGNQFRIIIFDTYDEYTVITTINNQPYYNECIKSLSRKLHNPDSSASFTLLFERDGTIKIYDTDEPIHRYIETSIIHRHGEVNYEVISERLYQRNISESIFDMLIRELQCYQNIE